MAGKTVRLLLAAPPEEGEKTEDALALRESVRDTGTQHVHDRPGAEHCSENDLTDSSSDYAADYAGEDGIDYGESASILFATVQMLH